MSTGVQPDSGRVRASSAGGVVVWQTLCILAAIGFVWSCVAFKWPCRFLEDPRDEARWSQAGFLGAGVLTLGCLALLPVLRHVHAQRDKSVTVCSYCRKVHTPDNDWEHFEVFFSTRRLAHFSHGVCPECGDRVMQEYRAGKEDAGAAGPPETRRFVA
ncbi:MAG: hypothetical protein KJ726_11400 [Verrucomicrobia bacterium]|nr:hypothetical protein [Verrucomicrobiota bacterium]MBU1910643.1 hypothetical protein [Verrucomicrobiota bacterium]